MPALFALLGLLLMPHCASPARTDELEALRRENARLHGEVEALRAELSGRPAAGGDGSEPKLEQVFVPRSRVSVEVTQKADTGKTSVASLWYRTVDTKPLPRMEWLQVRAEQTATGEVAGAWLLIERHAGRGSVEAEAAHLTIDGRVVELRAAGYETSREGQSPARVASGKKQERASFALPDGALAQVATAVSVHFEAGSVEFDLTDEHLAAFAAVAARVGPARGTNAGAPIRE